MQQHRSQLLGLALALACAPALHASSTVFTGQYSFGDSLSDSGNTYAVSYHTQPAGGAYWQGRWSNGPVFTERLTQSLALTTTSSIQSYINYAYGGATAATGSAVPSLGQQLQMFQAGGHPSIRSTDLFTVLAGANDIINAMESTAPTTAVSAGSNAANLVGDSVKTLASLGAKNIVVLSLPNIGSTPLFSSDASASALGTQASSAFNSTLESRLTSLRSSVGSDVNLVRIDLDKVLTRIRKDYQYFGYTNANSAFYRQDMVIQTAPAGTDANTYVFFDLIHPSAHTHALIASIVLEAVNPQVVLGREAALGTGLTRLADLSREAYTGRFDDLAKTPAGADTRTRVYGSFHYGSGRDEAWGDAAALNSSARSYTVGADTPLGSRARLGLSLAENDLGAAASDRSLGFRAADQSLRGYATWHGQAWTVGGDLSLGSGHLRDLHRATGFGGLPTYATTKENHWGAGLRAAYLLPLGAFHLSPFADLRYESTHIDGLNERDVEVLSFGFDAQREKSLRGQLGLQASTSAHLFDRELTFIAEVGVSDDLRRARHELSGKLLDNYTLSTTLHVDEPREARAEAGLFALLHLSQSLGLELGGRIERHADYRLTLALQAGF